MIASFETLELTMNKYWLRAAFFDFKIATKATLKRPSNTVVICWHRDGPAYINSTLY